MAMGCAIVAPAKPNIQEILTSGKDAVLFDPGDRSAFRMAVERVCNDSALREQISKRAQETIIERDLTWESNARRVISIFVQLGARDTRPNREQ
jgi:glycosyltransferase involved in cell wall biosynthesis